MMSKINDQSLGEDVLKIILDPIYQPESPNTTNYPTQCFQTALEKNTLEIYIKMKINNKTLDNSKTIKM